MTVELIVNATIPEGTSANATVFEDTDQDGTADNSENATLQDGERVYELTSLTGGTGNDYWIEYQLNSDPEEPSPTINDSLIESEPPDAIVEAEIDANVPLSMTVTATVYEDRNLDGTATNSESFNVEDGFNYYRLNTLDGGTADYWIEYTFEGPETSNAEIVSSTIDNNVVDLNVTADVTASVPAGTSATLIFYEDRNQDGVADNTQEVSLSDGTERYSLSNFVGGTGNDYWVDRELQSDGDETTPEVSEITVNTDTKDVELSTTATVPGSTSLDVTVYEDQDLDGEADSTGTVAVTDGSGTQGVGELGGGNNNQYWIDREYQTTDETQSPELSTTTLNTNAAATTVENTVSDNANITSATATPQTSTESVDQTVADAASVTSATATPLTSTETTVATQTVADNASITSATATPLTSTEEIEQIGGTDNDLFEKSAARYTQTVTKDSGDNWPITIDQTIEICVDNLNQVEEVTINSFTDGCAVTQTINDITDDDADGCVVVDAEFELACNSGDTVELTIFAAVKNSSTSKSTFISDTESSVTTDNTTGTNTTVGAATIETGNKITEIDSNTVNTTQPDNNGTVSVTDKTNRVSDSQVAGTVTGYGSLPVTFSQKYVIAASEVEMLSTVNVIGESNKNISINVTGFNTDTDNNEVVVNVDITISGENDGSVITYKVLIDLVYGAKRTKTPGGGTNVGRGSKIVPSATTSDSRFVPARTRIDVLENVIDATSLPEVPTVTSEGCQFSIESPSFVAEAFIETNVEFSEAFEFNDDGTKLYATDSFFDTVSEYSLSNAYDLTTISFTTSESIRTDAGNDGESITFKPDGSKMYLSSDTFVREYDLSTEYDISTLSLNQSVDFSAQTGVSKVSGVEFFSGGGGMTIMAEDGTFYDYNLSTSYDPSTATYTGDSIATIAQLGFKWGKSGEKLVTIEFDNTTGEYNVLSYDATTQYDVTTLQLERAFSIGGQLGIGSDVTFNSDGTSLFVGGRADGTGDSNIVEYSLCNSYLQYNADVKKTGSTPESGPSAGTSGWTTSLNDGEITYTPLVNRDNILFYTSNGTLTSEGNLYSLDKATGGTNFNDTTIIEQPGHSQQIVSDGIYISGTDSDGNEHLVKYSISNQSVSWQKSINDSLVSGIIVDGGRVYTVNNNNIFAYNTKNGEEIWFNALSNSSTFGAGPMSIALDRKNDRLVFTDEDSGVAAHDTSDEGTELWTNTNVNCNSSPSIFDGDVLLFDSSQSGIQLTRLDGADGSVVWREGVDAGDVLAAPSVKNDVVYYLSQSSSEARAVNFSDGSLVWSEPTTSSTASFINISSVLTGDGQMLAVDDNNGVVESFDQETGSQNWRYQDPDNENIGGISVSDSIAYITIRGFDNDSNARVNSIE